MKKRIFSALLISALAVSALTACGGSSSAKKSGQTLTVLNYGKYIDILLPEAIISRIIRRKD